MENSDGIAMPAVTKNPDPQYPHGKAPPEYTAQPFPGSPNPTEFQLQGQSGFQYPQYNYGQPPPGYYNDAFYQGSIEPYPESGFQQQQCVVVGGGAPVVTQPRVYQYQSYCAHITLACFVFWLCGWIFGLIAFILAVLANNSRNDPKTAQSLGRASIGVSIAGIIVGAVIIAVAVGLIVTNTSTDVSTCSSTICSRYDYYGRCEIYTTYYYTC